MRNTNTARDIIWPTDTDILLRAVFLYVGQGSSIVLLVADGDTYRTLLVDINLDEANGGMDVPRLIEDLVGEDGLDAFVNTHPHDDHLCGITALSNKVDIGEVWHSGHVPGKKYGACYDDLKQVIEKVKAAGGKEMKLLGSREPVAIGEAEYYVLAPAEYVDDEINDAKADERYQRIHEHCAVLKFGSGDSWILITGDADRDAFEKHIAAYHKDRLGAVILDAAHHGSRTFFRYKEEDEPYEDALGYIAPEYVIISAPTSEESPHDHPHDDAVELYKKKVDEDNILHTGQERYSFICDIYRDGDYGGVEDDKGRLADEYTLEKDNEEDTGEDGAGSALVAPAYRPGSRVDQRPMGRL